MIPEDRANELRERFARTNCSNELLERIARTNCSNELREMEQG